MFYSETILSRRGPLGKVWLAAHMERKLSKTQTLQTDIEQSVDAIMGQEIEVMALRLSGQLLLGVVRIYSRKAKYLLDDCNEALLKIKMAFRPGLVDMTDEQLVVSKNAITLPSNTVDLDLLLPDPNWDLDFERYPQHSLGHHQAHVDDITLHPMDNLQHWDVDLFDVGAHEGIESQGFQDIDIGINWDDERHHASRDDISSLEIGRDASPRASVNSYIEGRVAKPVSLLSERSIDHASAELQRKETLDVEFPAFEGLDLVEFGVGFDHQDPQTYHERVLSRASSPLTELPLTPPPPPLSNILDVNHLDGKPTGHRKVRAKRQIVDSITELQDDIESSYPRFDDTLDTICTMAEQQFLRKSPIVLRLLEVHNNPAIHFFNGKGKQQNAFHCAGPSGLEPELTKLFMRPTGRHLAKRSLSPSGHLSSKRPRTENIEEIPDIELEYGRKDASPTASLRLGSDVLRRSIDFDIAPTVAEDRGPHFDDQMDVRPDTFELELDMPSTFPHASKSPQEPELTHVVDETLADDSCPLAVLGSGPLHHSQDAEPSVGRGGFSKNTLRAMEIIRKELSSSAPGRKPTTLNFQALSDKATRRAAASFFFELLVLGTRDCLGLSQHAALDNIEIIAKEKFWSRPEL